jgi:RND family efflux transporter MFP subunit
LHEVSEEDRRSTRRMWIIGILAVLAIVGLWFLNRSSEEPALADDGAQVPVVSVVSPGRSTVVGQIAATGTLAARREMPVGAVGEGGQVVRVLVEPGDWVGAGQVLAVIDRDVQTQQQASLAAQVQVAQADARLAQSNLDRALKLVDRGFISKADVDRLTATRDASNARVRVAQAQLAEMRARTSRLNITAPAAGLVLERNVEPGQVVSPGSGVLFSLAKGGEMELLANVSEDELMRIPQGVAASVTPVGSEKSFTGQVWQISPVIDAQTRQGTARIALSYSPELRPGGFASAEITAGTVVAPMLPESALLSDNKGSYVYIVGKDNKAERRAVKTGTITSAGVIISEGLTGTEQVVVRAGAFLADGETIKPRRVKES